MKDHCTWFPEYWFKIVKWKITKVYIGGCCMIHDEACNTVKFYRCLRKKVSKFWARFITTGGAIGCYSKYPKQTIKEDFGDKNG